MLDLPACYWIAPSGQIVDLTALCGVRESVASPPVVPIANPVAAPSSPVQAPRVAFSRMRGRLSQAVPGAFDILGEVENVSTEVVRVRLVEFQLEGADGTVRTSGVAEVYATLQPGQKANIKAFVLQESGLRTLAGIKVVVLGYTGDNGYSRVFEAR